ncbi:glutaredoxin-like [Haliotis rubra]|uniref:glutaredoxin-like n=1 Tax=Haliotis rubra TaxID=36100 RepID=UPI001EE535F8|nr:glutaredoxin-like [Haliotis rubra]
MGGSHSKSDPPRYMNSKEAREVAGLITENCVMVFSKTYCPYCKEVKNIFKNMNVPFQCVELDIRHDGQELQDILQYLTKARTVPRVFVNGECIGGCSETKALYQTGQLKDKLESCGS